MFRARGNERGGISGYLIGLIAITALIVGGVFLLKNLNSTDSNVDNTTTVTTASNDGAQQANSNDSQTGSEGNTSTSTSTADSNTNSSNAANSGTSNTTSDQTSQNSSNLASTGDTAYTPESLTATGPEDFVPTMIATILVGGAIYAVWNYRLSRIAVRSALLRK